MKQVFVHSFWNEETLRTAMVLLRAEGNIDADVEAVRVDNPGICEIVSGSHVVTIDCNIPVRCLHTAASIHIVGYPDTYRIHKVDSMRPSD
jgi:hypothetical protein